MASHSSFVLWFLVLIACGAPHSSTFAQSSATRPAPGTFLRPESSQPSGSWNGQERAEYRNDQRRNEHSLALPPLWQPIMLVSGAGVGVVVSATVFFAGAGLPIPSHSSSPEETTPREDRMIIGGLAGLLVSGGALAGGLVWLHRRATARKRIKRMATLMDPSEPFSLGIMGVGLQMHIRM